MIGSSSVRLGDVSRDGGGARTHDEQTAGSGIRTSGRCDAGRLERRQGKVKATCLRSPPSPMTPDHPVAVVVNPDASHSFAARDSDGHAAHGQRDRGGSFGSAVRPRVAARAGPIWAQPSSTINLAAIAAATDQHLSTATDTQKETGWRSVRAVGLRTWTKSTTSEILPPHSCSARCGAWRRC